MFSTKHESARHTFPAKRRAMAALASIAGAAIVFHAVGFPIPLALLIAAILWATVTQVSRFR